MFFWHENNYNHIKLHIVIALSGVAAMASLANLFFWWVSDAQVFRAMSKMESLKAWGDENWSKIQQLYNSEGFKTQQSQAIEQTLQKFAWAEETITENNNTPEKEATKILSSEKIKLIKENSYIEWEKDAKFIIVEYTDLECPFCVRQFKEETVKNVMAERNDVAHIVKVVQWVNHENTEYKSLATICWWKLKWENWYYTMFNNIMWWTKGSFPQFTLTTREDVVLFSNKIDITTNALNDCMADSETKNIYSSYRQEAISLEATGTPWNIIINTENGKYIHLAWAYPASAFIEALSKLE